MRIKTNLKIDTHADDNPYYRLYLSLFEEAYRVKLSSNGTHVTTIDSQASEAIPEQNINDEKAD